MLTIAGLRRDYQTGTQTATDVIDASSARIEGDGLSPIWISLADRDGRRSTARRASIRRCPWRECRSR